MWPLRQPESASSRFHPIEKNLRTMMQFFALARPSGCVVQPPGLQLVSSGIDFSPFNSAMLSEPISSLNSSLFEKRIDEAAKFFEGRSERWSFWLCDDMLPDAVLRRSKMILLRHRLRQTSEPPGMLAEMLEPVGRPLPDDLEVLKVTDAKGRADFSAITACTFDLPYSICREVYQSDRSWSGPLAGWVGYVRDEPIATCATVVDQDVIGIYTVSTIPEFRRRGYSEKLMRYVIARTQQETGIRTSILQSTPAGYPMYHKMGYRKAARFSIFLSEH
jgi:ribosomal protein S18 acetylase RimI-like enzyme